MDTDLLDDLIKDRQAEWSDTASLDGPGCGQTNHAASCLCDVKLKGEPTATNIPPYVRTDILRAMWLKGTHRDVVNWLTACVVIADLEAMFEQHADGISLLKEACAMSGACHQRSVAVHDALGVLFGGGLNLEQSVALTGIPPVTILGASSGWIRTPDKAARMMRADMLLRSRVCPSYKWVADEVGLQPNTVRKYAQRWGLKVAGKVQRGIPIQVRQFIENLALSTPLKTGEIQRQVQASYGASAPKYMATAQIISRLRAA